MSGPGASAHATRPEGFARVFSQAQSGQTPARPCGCPLSNTKNTGEPAWLHLGFHLHSRDSGSIAGKGDQREATGRSRLAPPRLRTILTPTEARVRSAEGGK